MSKVWRVTYHFAQPIDVVAPTQYPGLRIACTYTTDGRLAEVSHEIDASTQDEARRDSRKVVQRLFAALEYTRGTPVVPSNVTAFSAEPTGLEFSLDAAGTVTDAVSAARMPLEVTLASPNNRLDTWLLIANKAAQSDDAQAIRDYFLVIEDSAVGLQPGSAGSDLKRVRNFVSHPQCDDIDVIRLVNKELGRQGQSTCPPYDPRDPAQQAMLKKWRTEARRIVQSQIDQLLV